MTPSVSCIQKCGDFLQLSTIQRLVDLPMFDLLYCFLGVVKMHLGVLKVFISTVIVFKSGCHVRG